MKTKPGPAVFILLLLIHGLLTGAQTLTVQKGLSTVEFNHPSGKVKVYLPDDIRVGDIIRTCRKKFKAGNKKPV